MKLSAAAFLVLLFLCGVQHAKGAVIDVCPFCAYSSVYSAVPHLGLNDSLEIGVGTYLNEQPISINRTLTIAVSSEATIDCPTCSPGEPWLTVVGTGIEKTVVTLDGEASLLTINGSGIVVAADAKVVQAVQLTINTRDVGVDIQGGMYESTKPLAVNVRPATSPPGDTVFGVGVSENGGFLQRNDLTISGYDGAVGVLQLGGIWRQHGMATITITNAGYGVRIQSNAQLWNQTATLQVEALGSPLSSLYPIVVSPQVPGFFWYQMDNTQIDGGQTGLTLYNTTFLQRKSLSINLANSTSAVGALLGTGTIWNSTAGVLFHMSTVNGTALQCENGTINLSASDISVSYAMGSQPKLLSAPCIRNLISIPSTTPWPTASASFVKPSPNQPPPKLQFNNITVPAVQIIPRDISGAEQPQSSVSMLLANVIQVERLNRSVLLSSSVINGSWHNVAPDPHLGSSTTYVYSAALVFPALKEDEEDLPDGRIELQFDLFDNATTVEISNVVSFLVTPEKAKLTLRVFEWPWDFIKETHPDVPSELEIRLAIDPIVKQVQRSVEGQITTFDLKVDRNVTSPASSDAMQIRLIDAVELDSFLILKGGVKFDVDVASSELVMSFAYFNRSLIYDPDIGVLLGAKGSSGSDDNTAMIVAVAVIVPIAVVLGVLIIAGVLVLGWWRHRHLRNSSSPMVNFEEEDEDEDDGLI